MSVIKILIKILLSPYHISYFIKNKLNKRLENKILREGIKTNATITYSNQRNDPNDDEHTIYELEFSYYINNIKIEKKSIFSINTAHIEYGYHGMLINTPKFKYSIDDFNRSLKAGETIEVISLDKPPYHFINNFNEVSREIMGAPHVWS